MPQPFEDFTMQQLQNWQPQTFREEAKKINANEKIGDLAHFLIQNFREDIDSSEHVIDTAIRLLSATRQQYSAGDNWIEWAKVLEDALKDAVGYEEGCRKTMCEVNKEFDMDEPKELAWVIKAKQVLHFK